MKRSMAWRTAVGLLFLGVAATGSGAVLCVDGDGGNDTNSGAGWGSALKTVTNALARASAPGEIWVKAGIYRPTADTDRTRSFTMRSGVDLYGGFAGDETLRSERDWTNHETVLSGDIGAAGDSSDNSYHVVSGATARIDGFIIRDGRADGLTTSAKGGGMYTSGAYPQTANCTFSSNFAAGGTTGGAEGGGGVYWYQATYAACTVSWVNCTFDGNTAFHASQSTYGGGMYLAFLTNATCLISNCLFRNNIATGALTRVSALCLTDAAARTWTGGLIEVADCVFSNNPTYQFFPGGVYVNGFVAPVAFRDCLFVANTNFSPTITHGGGAMGVNVAALGQGVQMTRCVFDGNRSTNFGGAVFFYGPGGTHSVWRDCVFRNNAAVSHGGAVYGSVDGTFDNCDFISNSCSGANAAGGAVHASATVGSAANDVFTNCRFVANSVGSGNAGAAALYSSLTFQECRFENNGSAGGSGGALYINNTVITGTVTRCAFVSNASAAAAGGAISLSPNAALLLTGSTFIRNTAVTYGGALYSAAGTAPIVSDCLFVSNKTTVNYGGAWHSLGPSRLSRCVFAGNMASNGYGGGLCFRDLTAATGQVVNCVFRDNRGKYGGGIATLNAAAVVSNVTAFTNLSLTAGYGGGLCHATATYTCQVDNCIFWDNGPSEIQQTVGVTCRYSCVRGGFAGPGNTAVNPQFAEGTYLHLQSRTGYYDGGYFSGGGWLKSASNSPLIDAGDPDAGCQREPSPNGGRINMGAYGDTAVASKSRFPAGAVLLVR